MHFEIGEILDRIKQNAPVPRKATRSTPLSSSSIAFTRSPTVLESGRRAKIQVSSREGRGTWKRGRPPGVRVTDAPVLTVELHREDTTATEAQQRGNCVGYIMRKLMENKVYTRRNRANLCAITY